MYGREYRNELRRGYVDLGILASLEWDLLLIELIEVALPRELVELAREAVVPEVGQVALGELKLGRILSHQLIHAVEEEDEQRREVLERETRQLIVYKTTG